MALFFWGVLSDERMGLSFVLVMLLALVRAVFPGSESLGTRTEVAVSRVELLINSLLTDQTEKGLCIFEVLSTSDCIATVAARTYRKQLILFVARYFIGAPTVA
jgi:hypothetical protein